MKKILLLIAFFFQIHMIAQDKSGNCKFDYQVSLKNILEDETKRIYKSQIFWDFSKLNNKIDCTIEIVPIRDCINGEDAIKFKETILFSTKDKNFKDKDSKEIRIADFMTKCFKWRVIVVDPKTKCEEITDWKYNSFLNN
jgi:hypothetical protein